MLICGVRAELSPPIRGTLATIKKKKKKEKKYTRAGISTSKREAIARRKLFSDTVRDILPKRVGLKTMSQH